MPVEHVAEALQRKEAGQSLTPGSFAAYSPASACGGSCQMPTTLTLEALLGKPPQLLRSGRRS